MAQDSCLLSSYSSIGAMEEHTIDLSRSCWSDHYVSSTVKKQRTLWKGSLKVEEKPFRKLAPVAGKFVKSWQKYLLLIHVSPGNSFSGLGAGLVASESSKTPDSKLQNTGPFTWIFSIWWGRGTIIIVVSESWGYSARKAADRQWP